MSGATKSEVVVRRGQPVDVYKLLRNAAIAIAAVFIVVSVASLAWLYSFADDGLYCAVGELTTGGVGYLVAIVVGISGLILLAFKPLDGAVLFLLAAAVPGLPFLLGLIAGVTPSCTLG